MKENKRNSSIIGEFEGTCADSTITNENGLDITREVWEKLFSSDDYKEGIANGWYIGRLGHPEDPCDENYKEGCIVMTDGGIKADGTVWGKFNLIDTPVGRVVKTFIDAGVKFGISVRGIGDIEGNSVDPDTFVFKGFDLVVFPAWRSAIPTFQAIAASADMRNRANYLKIVASCMDNIKKIESCEALDIIQSQFPKQSPVYKEIEDQKARIRAEQNDGLDISDEQISALVMLYKEALAENEMLKSQLKSREYQIVQMSTQNDVYASRKLQAVKRISEDQIAVLSDKAKCLERTNTSLIVANRRLKGENSRILASIESSSAQAIKASKDAESRCLQYKSEISQLKDQLSKLKDRNLHLKQKVTSSTRLLKDKDSTIASLESRVSETVRDLDDVQERSSNRDAELSTLRSDMSQALEIIADYQDAYANLYGTVTGRDFRNIDVDPTTSVEELRKLIGSTNTCNIPVKPDTYAEDLHMMDDIDYGDDDSNLVMV